MVERVETVVVGGGQAGLAMSALLSRAGREHLVLERGRVVERWRSERWDSLTLLTPNWHTRLPGAAYVGPDPDGFATRDEVVAWFERYAAEHASPVRTGVEVTALAVAPNGRYRLQTTTGEIEAAKVVVATGPYARANVLAAATDLPLGPAQIHSSAYRNPGALPPGAVLVVGGGASGLQIAEDLRRGGRDVILSVGRTFSPPRRHRGRDLYWWQEHLGILDRPVDDLPSPSGPFPAAGTLTGVDGGHDLSLRTLVADGVRVVGRLAAADGDRLTLADSLPETLRRNDRDVAALLADFDRWAAARAIDLPPAPPPETTPLPGPAPSTLSLRAEGISTVIWATGFRPDFDWVRLPVIGPDGHPVHRRGVTSSPGLAFLGLRWLSRRRSTLIGGVGADAEHLLTALNP